MVNDRFRTLLILKPTNVYPGKLKCSAEKVSIVYGVNDSIPNSGQNILFFTGFKYSDASPVNIPMPLCFTAGAAVWLDADDQIHLYFELRDNGKGFMLEDCIDEPQHYLFDTKYIAIFLDNIGNKYQAIVALIDRLNIERIIVEPSSWPVRGPGRSTFDAVEVTFGLKKIRIRMEIAFDAEYFSNTVRPPGSKWLMTIVTYDKIIGMVAWRQNYHVHLIVQTQGLEGREPGHYTITMDYEVNKLEHLKRAIDSRNITTIDRLSIPQLTFGAREMTFGRIKRKKGAQIDFDDEHFSVTLVPQSTPLITFIPYNEIIGMTAWAENGHVHLLVQLTSDGKGRILDRISQFSERDFDTDHFLVKMDESWNMELEFLKRTIELKNIRTIDQSIMLATPGTVSDERTSINQADPIEVVIDHSTFIVLFMAAVRYGSGELEKKVLKYAATIPLDKSWPEILHDRLHEYMRIELLKRKQCSDDSE